MKIYNTIYDIFRFKGELSYNYGNSCDPNANILCDNVKSRPDVLNKFKENEIDAEEPKILIINHDGWDKSLDRETLSVIESLYGSQAAVIGAAYHALFYMRIISNGEIYHIAIETGSQHDITKKYTMQIYIGTSDDFATIIQTRYQCLSFGIIPCNTCYYSHTQEDIQRHISKGKTKKYRRKKNRSKKSKRIRKKIRQRI